MRIVCQRVAEATTHQVTSTSNSVTVPAAARRRSFYPSRRVFLASVGVFTLLPAWQSTAAVSPTAQYPVQRTDEEWRAILSPRAYDVLRHEGTERPNESPLAHEERCGQFQCGGCSAPLFDSKTKFDSGTGWPSFFQPFEGAVVEELDTSLAFMPRTGIRCSNCGGHLGHVFDDGPKPTGKRYCMNGFAMKFVPCDA